MFKNKILKFLLLVLIFISKIEINSAVELGDYDSNARAAAVIPYGRSRDGETYILFAYEICRASWTTPGGARGPSYGTILDTAVSELYEETAAFPIFDPVRIKPMLKSQDASCVFNISNTDIFALNIGDCIDECPNIGVNYQQRISGRPYCFHEMNQWKLVNVKNLYRELDSYTHSVNHNLNLLSVGPMMSYVFNGLWNFYQTGLKNVIDTSINNSNIISIPTPVSAVPIVTPTSVPAVSVMTPTSVPAVPVMTPTSVPAVPVMTPTSVPAVPVMTPTPIPAVPVMTPTPIPAVPVITSTIAPLQSLRFGKELNASKLSPLSIVTKRSIITPKIVSIPNPLKSKSSRFSNLFNSKFGAARTSTSSITPLRSKSSRFSNLFNNKFGAARTSTSSITPLRSQSSKFNSFKGFRSVKTSTPAIGIHKSRGGLFSNFRKTQTPISKNQVVKTHQTRNFFSLLKLLNK